MDAILTPDLSAPERKAIQVSSSAIAVAAAGMCTFLNVYTTQSLLPYMRSLYNASEVQVSLTVSATTLGMALAAPFLGLLAEAVGRKRVVVPALFGLVVPTTLAATSTSLHVLIVWRFVQGIFTAGIITVMLAYIGEEWPANGVGFAMSTYVSGTVLGGFLGRFLAGLISAHYNWRYSFVVLGATTLAGAVAVRHWLPPAANFVPSANAGATLRQGLLHLRNPRLVATFGMGFAMLFALVGTFNYVNFYLAAPPFGLNSAHLGCVFFVYLLGLVVTPLAGSYMDRRGFRRTIVLAFCLSITGLGLSLKPSLAVIIPGLALAASGIFILQASATTHLGKVAGRARSSAAGLYVTFYYIGGSTGAVLPAYFWVRGGWPATVALLSVAVFACVALGFAASRPEVV